MYPHRIRLRGPWEYEPLVRFGGAGQKLPNPGKMTLPCRWNEGGLVSFAGRVRFRRRFHWPGRIDAHERVWLTVAGVDSSAEVWLNHNFLGQHQGTGPFEFEVTSLLQVRNDLLVEVESAEEHGGLWGEVALEVRCTAYLRGVACSPMRRAGKLHLDAKGEVVGSAERTLELYVLLDSKTIGYATVEPAVGGRAFQLLSDELPPNTAGPHLARVDLVNGATIWYVVEHEVTFAEALPPEAGN